MPVTMTVPAGTTEIQDLGLKYKPAADGTIQVPENRVPAFQKMGCTVHVMPATSTTAKRPTTGLAPGLMVFDSTLGKPIWRNAANSGWVDATGTAV